MSGVFFPFNKFYYKISQYQRNHSSRLKKCSIRNANHQAQYNCSVGSLPNMAFQLTGTTIFVSSDTGASMRQLSCFIKSTASHRLSPSDKYLNNIQHGSAPLTCWYIFNANTPPWMTLFVRCHSIHPLFSICSWYWPRYCSSHTYMYFVVPIECCSCAKLPVNITRSLILCCCKNSIRSAKNAVNGSPLTSGARSWKHANLLVALMNSSHAVVILLDCDDESTSAAMLCSYARGPSTGIIDCWRIECVCDEFWRH